jgi:regulator of protease activity HflC (stomatin/prohibitin superfamily)
MVHALACLALRIGAVDSGDIPQPGAHLILRHIRTGNTMDSIFGSLAFYVPVTVVCVFGLISFFKSWFTVEQQTRRVVTRFGKFVRVASPGLSFKVPFVDRVSSPISLKVQQLELSELTYTDKGTSVTISANVQYVVDDNDESVKQAFYKLANPEGQIKSHVSSAIRAKVPTMTLEDVQAKQASIASHVKSELTTTMSAYGYTITDVLVTKADPDASVVTANNEKYASEQAKVTAENLAAAAYTKVVKAAQGDAEAMIEHGRGIAGERKQIMGGLEEAITSFGEKVSGTSAQDAMRMVAFQGYLDSIVKIATNASDGTKVIFVPVGPGASADMVEQIRTALITGNEAAKDVPVPAGAPKAE